VSFTYTLKSNLVNEIRWGIAYNDQPRNGAQDGPTNVKELGLLGLVPDFPDVAGMLNVSWSGVGIQALTQQVWRHPGFKNKFNQIQEQLSWYRGRHNLKFGAMINRVYYADAQQNTALFGSVTFSNRYTGLPYADFLLGIPTTYARAFPAVLQEELRQGYDSFAADTFKVTPNLTVDIGLRYELHPPARNLTGYTSTFDIGSGKIVVPDDSLSKVSKLVPTSYVGIVGASSVGLPPLLAFTDKNNFAPRIGIAWRPFGPNTVFRAGYGIYYDIVPTSATSGGVPSVLNEPSQTNSATNPEVIFPRVFTSTAVFGPSTISLPQARDPHLVIPYSMQYNFTIEHLVGSNAFRLSYIGTNTRKGEYGYNIVVDHCSMSWAVDENLSASGPRYDGPQGTSHNLTFSNNILAEGLRDSSHTKGSHSKGSLIHDNCRNIAVIGNLYAQNDDRNPYFKAFTTGVIVNNVVCNPDRYAIEVNWIPEEWVGQNVQPENARVAVVGNVVIHGANTPAGLAAVSRKGDVFLEDNISLDRDGKPAPMTAGEINLLKQKPVWPAGLVAMPAKDTVAWVIAHGGARPKDRDEVDKRIVRDFEQRHGHFIDSQEEVGGYPKVAPVRRNLDVPKQNVEAWLAKLAVELE
jgi:hypothetical protein